MKFEPGYQTQCWDCTKPYDVTLSRCPHCNFANANEMPSTAWLEQKRVDAARRRPFGPISFDQGKPTDGPK